MNSLSTAQFQNITNFLWVFAISMITFLAFYFIALIITKIVSRFSESYMAHVMNKELKRFPIVVWVSLSIMIALAFTSLADEYQKIYDILLVIVSFFFFAALVNFINRLISSWFDHKASMTKDATRSHYYKYVSIVVRVCVWFIGLVALFSVLGVDLNSLFAFLGLTSLGLSYALRNTIKDAINSFIIVFHRPFKVGDYVKTMEVYGKVRETGLKSTKLDALDGRTLIVPNSQLMDKTTHNYHQRKIAKLKYEIKIETPKLARYERKLRKIVGELYRGNKEIRNNSLDLVLRSLTDEGHTYTLEAVFDLEKRNTLDDLARDMMHSIFDTFKKNGIKTKEVTLLDKPFAR